MAGVNGGARLPKVDYAKASAAPADIEQLKARCIAAWRKARERSALPGPIVDRLWSDCLMLMDGQPPRVQQIMLGETECLFRLAVARVRWLHPPREASAPQSSQARRHMGPVSRNDPQKGEGRRAQGQSRWR